MLDVSTTNPSKNDRIGLKNLRGKEIFLINYRNLKDKALHEAVLYTHVEIELVRKDTIFLVDVRGAQVSYESFKLIVDASKKVQPYVLKSAVLGITGIKRSLFNVYKNLTKSKVALFDHMEEAEDYLLR